MLSVNHRRETMFSVNLVVVRAVEREKDKETNCILVSTA